MYSIISIYMTTILPGEYIDTRQGPADSAPIKRCAQNQVNTDPPNGHSSRCLEM